jgi:hypothetical protein
MLLIIFGIVCSLTTSILHKIILWFAPINIFGPIGICIALLITAKDRITPVYN